MKAFKKIVLLTESDEEDLLKSIDDDVQFQPQPSVKKRTVFEISQVVNSQSNISKDSSAAKSSGGSLPSKNPLPQLPSPPYTVKNLTDSYKIMNYIHNRNEITGFTDFRQWINEYYDPRDPNLPKIDGRGIEALYIWAKGVISSRVERQPPMPWPVNPTSREEEVALAELPSFFFRMCNEREYLAKWLAEAFNLIGAVNGEEMTKDDPNDGTVDVDAEEAVKETLTKETKEKNKKSRRKKGKSVKIWQPYTILEKPSSLSETSCTVSAAYGGVTGDVVVRGKEHLRGITDHKGVNYLDNPALYNCLSESLAGGRDVYMISVLPDFVLTEATAFTVEALIIAFFKMLPQCKNRLRGSYTIANNPLLNALAKSDSEFMEKCGCALWIRRLRSFDAFTPPLVKAQPSTELVDCLMLRVLNKSHDDSEEQKTDQVSEEPPAKKAKYLAGDKPFLCPEPVSK